MSNQLLITIGMLAGGIGLFLLAMGMITDGLKLAAGNRLKDLLESWTSTPIRGAFMGISITALVQSSSAVTVATIGFVNAGLITLYQALGIIFGTNVGTTVTAWLVAIVGFQIKVESFALPLIGIGMILRLLGGNQRYGYFGTALAGFGLFFIGIDVLKDAFVGITEAVDITKFTLQGIYEVFAYVGIGFLMTVLTQSSSAAIAITLTAASGGVLGLYAAASMVIGANVGTTSTAVFSVIGATSNAKRVASAHVIFNIITAVIALLILPVLFKVVSHTRDLLGMEDIPAVTLALFHTIFNILGLLIMWPFSRRLANFLKGRFVTQEEIESRPQHLDKTIAASPDLAINALVLEITRALTIVRRMALTALRKEKYWAGKVSKDYMITEKLLRSVSDFIAHFEKASLTDDLALKLSKILLAQQHLSVCADETLELTKLSLEKTDVMKGDLEQTIIQLRKEAIKLFDIADTMSDRYTFNENEIQLERFQTIYDRVKPMLLESGVKQIYSIKYIMLLLEEHGHIRRMSRQLIKTLKDLDDVQFKSLDKPIFEDV